MSGLPSQRSAGPWGFQLSKKRCLSTIIPPILYINDERIKDGFIHTLLGCTTHSASMDYWGGNLNGNLTNTMSMTCSSQSIKTLLFYLFQASVTINYPQEVCKNWAWFRSWTWNSTCSSRAKNERFLRGCYHTYCRECQGDSVELANGYSSG